MTDDEQPQYTRDDLDRIGALWCERIAQAEKLEEKWCKDAEAAEVAFAAGTLEEEGDVPRFNILHSNVETIASAVYNSTPIPDVRPRHNRKDPVGKAVADAIKEAIAAQIDDDRLTTEVEAQVQDATLAGRGVVRVRFDADEVVQADQMGQPFETLTNERLVYEVVSWRDYREGPAKRWADVPWVAYRHYITTEDKDRLEQDDLAAIYAQDMQPDATNEAVDEAIWECWCKETGKVYWVLDASQRVVAIMDDPLGLSGFFPQGEPIQPIKLTGRRLPVCPYSVYRELAAEVDRLTRRIDKIVEGLKARGIIAVGAEEVERLAEAGDNELVVAGDMEGIMAMGGLDKAIAWWPIDKLVAVLQALYAAREQAKQSIYEVTGISDIVRGASNSAETATAQQIKTQWGGLRIRKMQRMVERGVRDLFVLSAEIIAQHFTPDTLTRISGAQDPQVLQAMAGGLDHYRIDVESDSTVRADLTRGRGEMAEFLNGTAQFFSTMAPIIQQSPETAGPMAALFSSFARQFSLGREAEEAVAQMAEMAGQAGAEQAQQARAQQQQMAQQMQALEMQKGQAEVAVKMAEAKAKEAEIMGRSQERQIKAMEAQNRAMIDAKRVGLDADRLVLDERKAEVDAVTRGLEIEIEQDQRRPVAIGEV